MTKRFLISLAVAVVLATAAYGSDITMTVSGTVDNAGTPTVNPGCLIRATFRLTNTSGEAIVGLTNGFKFYTTGSAHITYLKADTLPIGWNQYLDGGPFIDRYSFDGMGVDTVGFGGYVMMRPGIPPGFSQDVWHIDMIVAGEGMLHLDTAFFPPGGVWFWSTNGGDVIPQWSGARTFPVEPLPCGATTFRNPITSINVPLNGPYAHRFVAVNSIMPGNGPTWFQIFDGPGELETIDDSTCEWHIAATPADLGRTDTLFIQASNCGTCASQVITLGFCEGGLDFGENMSTAPLVMVQGQSAHHEFYSDCPAFPLYLADDGGAPDGVCLLNGRDLVFNSTSNCRGYYPVRVGQTDGVDTVYCRVPVLVTDPVCQLRGNVDGKMNPEAAVNVADLTYLVNRLFRGGVEPANLEEGNVDGTGGIVVSDITYLVNFLFRSGPQPPACE